METTVKKHYRMTKAVSASIYSHGIKVINLADSGSLLVA